MGRAGRRRSPRHSFQFDSFGNSLSNGILTPQQFDAVGFGVFTTSAPMLLVDDVTNQIVGGDFSTWAFGYNGINSLAGASGSAHLLGVHVGVGDQRHLHAVGACTGLFHQSRLIR